MIRTPDTPTRTITVDIDALEQWADRHGVGVSEVTPGHFYAVRANPSTGIVEVRMAYGRAAS